MLGFDAIKCNFNLLEIFSPASLKLHICVSFQFFLTSVLHMKSIFPEKMESLCLCLSVCALRHVLAGASTIEAMGEGPGRHLSAFLASVISGHSAVLEGLRNRVRKVGGRACH